MKENIALDKSFDFAVRIVNLYKHITSNKKNMFTMAKPKINYAVIATFKISVF